MSAVHLPFPCPHVEAACAAACQAMAPAWPLDQAIAVNPHWPRIGMPVLEVAARLGVLARVQVFPGRALYRQAWQEGRVVEQDLQEALQRLGVNQAASQHANQALNPEALTVQACLQALEAQHQTLRLPLLLDVLDDDTQHQTRLSWRQAITHQVGQTCAAYFDEHQADWHPERTQGLYAFWCDTLRHDHGIGLLMGLPQLGRALSALPATRQEAEHWVLQRLGLPQAVWADYLEAVLWTVNGWASWCAYLGWQAKLAGGQDHHLRELLAIRLAWGAIVLDSTEDTKAKQAFAQLQSAWGQAAQAFAQAKAQLGVDEVWQLAMELAYQRQLQQALMRQTSTAAQRTDSHAPRHAPRHGQGTSSANAVGMRPKAQAVFCIDVRSEPMRRALESAGPGVVTHGFAGFFGVPMAYTPLGTQATRAQLPGLLAPTTIATDAVLPPAGSQAPTGLSSHVQQARHNRFAWAGQWLASSRWPTSAFSFVEASGAAYLHKLRQLLAPQAQPRPQDDTHGIPKRYRLWLRPQLFGLDIKAQVQLAQQVLQGMGVQAGAATLAPVVMLVAHGSQSRNNAHAAALDCGACCGQSGDPNARALAHLLNSAEVRQGLQAQGQGIPPDTWFVPVLHNTTTDELCAFDADLMPAATQAHWQALQPALAKASQAVRSERAPRLGLNPQLAPQALLQHFQRRACDGAQNRPEWGLAGNAALVMAPRQRTQGVVLAGRCFLHDYHPEADPEGTLLEQLMTAPMVVAHWINWQYHASVCEPTRLGSGNKVLHNVVGGRLGVFEGNGGDLRIGLPWQSVHNGERVVHDPLRLTVLVDAPPQRIDAIVAKHPSLQHLLGNGWLHLWCWQGQALQRWDKGLWVGV